MVSVPGGQLSLEWTDGPTAAQLLVPFTVGSAVLPLAVTALFQRAPGRDSAYAVPAPRLSAALTGTMPGPLTCRRPVGGFPRNDVTSIGECRFGPWLVFVASVVRLREFKWASSVRR